MICSNVADEDAKIWYITDGYSRFIDFHGNVVWFLEIPKKPDSAEPTVS